MTKYSPVVTFRAAVDVPGFGPFAAFPAEVADAQALGDRRDLRGPAVVEDVRAVVAPHVACRTGRAFDDGGRFPVRGDKDVHRGPPAVDLHPDRGPLQLIIQVKVRRVEQLALGFVEVVPAGILCRGEGGPQGQQDLEHHKGFTGDHHDVRQRVPGVGRVEQEGGIQQDTEDGQQDQHGQRG